MHPVIPRVAIVTNMLPPYRVAFFSELAKRCELLVVVDTPVEPNREWRVEPAGLPFAAEIGGGWAIPFRRRRADLNYTELRYLQFANRTIPILRRFQPDAVVSSELGLRSLQAGLYCRRKGAPLILWWEGTRHTEREEGALKLKLRKRLIPWAARFWSNGKASSEYLSDLGAPADCLDEGMTGVDVSRYVAETGALAPGRRALRDRLGLRGTVLLFVGALSERKGVRELLRALAELAREGHEDGTVLLVGSGLLRGEVEAFRTGSRSLGLVAAGFVDPEEIFPYYAAADVFVLPTLDDNWPLVTLEATASGLPQLFSCYNGAASDLCKSERFGRMVDPRDTSGFAKVLGEVIRNPPPRLLPEEVEAVAAYYSPEAQSDRAIASIEKALKATEESRKVPKDGGNRVERTP